MWTFFVKGQQLLFPGLMDYPNAFKSLNVENITYIRTKNQKVDNDSVNQRNTGDYVNHKNAAIYCKHIK